MTSLIIMAVAPSDRVDLERLVRLRPLREEIEDHVERHRRAVEQMSTERIGNRRSDGGGAGALDGLAYTLYADRVLRISLVDRTPRDLGRNVEIGRGLRLVEQGVRRQSELGIVDMPLEQREADTHDIAAADLVGEALRMQHGAAIRHAQHVDDVDLAGFDVEL